MESNIKQLRMFFRISNATFDLVNILNLANGGKTIQSEMHKLHKMALEEMEKESPDLLFINKLLVNMGYIAEKNSQYNEDKSDKNL